MPDGLSLSTFAPILQARRNTVESADRPTAQIPHMCGISTPVDAPRAQEKPRASCKLARGRFVVATAGDVLAAFPARGFRFRQTRRAGAPQVKTHNDATGRPAA